MRKFLKVFIIIITVIVLLVGGFAGYLYFGNSGNRDAFSLMPDDAIFIVETQNLNEGWEALSTSNVWKHLMENSMFEDINKSAESVDAIMKGNKTVELLLKDRLMIVSSHMVSKSDYDFLFVVDIENASKLSFMTEVLGLFDYTVKNRDYNEIEITELIDEKTKEKLSIAIVENLIVGSYSSKLVEKAIDQKDKNNWNSDDRFIHLKDKINSSNLFKFYLNYSQIDEYIRCYINEDSELVNSISEMISYTAFNADFENEEISLNGYTNLPDSLSSYLNAISKVKPGKMRAYELLSNKTALYFSMCFDDYDNFYNELEKQFALDSANFESLNKKVNRVERLLKVDLKRDFFSWIGTEIAFSKSEPTSTAREEDVIVAINTNNVDSATIGLDRLITQIKKRTPAKFETEIYRNYEIKHLDINGFFKMFFGKLFKKLKKPYFTIIEDFVIFSNSKESLREVVDNYIKGNTLSRKESFMDFKDSFEDKSNVSVFVQMPKIYSHMYHYSNRDKRISIKENRDLILSFANIGFQLISDGENFETKLIAKHDNDAIIYEEIEKMEEMAMELFITELDSLCFKPDLILVDSLYEGAYKLYYNTGRSDSTLKVEGFLNDGLPDGLWRSYSKSGNIYSVINYDDGIADGEAVFYYDTNGQNNKIKLTFADDLIDGDYREFHENGARKAVIEIDDGLFDGDAQYFHNNGELRLKGKFSDGKKKGSWTHFNEIGEVITIEKWRKGNRK